MKTNLILKKLKKMTNTKRKTKEPEKYNVNSSSILSADRMASPHSNVLTFPTPKTLSISKKEKSFIQSTVIDFRFPFFASEPSNLNPLRELDSSFEITDFQAVENYLVKRDKNVVSRLNDAISEIKHYFSVNDVFLEVLNDFDYSEGDVLCIRINTSDDADSVLDKQCDFNKGYWFKLPFDETKNIVINFNFDEI
jgi:hypothetical protein